MEFQEWGKTHRLFREIVVTEKIDGTNACVIFEKVDGPSEYMPSTSYVIDPEAGDLYEVGAQSRNRLITPEKDNYGFASWVYGNAEELFAALGPGRHYGEWWGAGIQRRYDQPGKRFSLFNTHRHADLPEEIGGILVDSVIVLYQGMFSEEKIVNWARILRQYGSMAAPGFMNPEGICIYHSQTRQVMKFTFDNNDKSKWESMEAGK